MRKFVCILFGVLFLIVASAAGTWATEAFSIYNIPPDHSAAEAKYWTAERMNNAIPRPTPKKTATLLQSSTGTLQQSTDTPGYDPSYDPRQKECQTSVLLPDDEAGALSPATDNASIGYNYPPPHTTFYVLSSLYGTKSTPFPYKAIGKVFYTGTDGVDYVCSGASIGGRAVLTAGHCVSDEKGTYYTNWIFVPAYHNREEPFGKWVGSSFLTFDSYHNGGNMARDVAFGVVKNEMGVKLSQKVGNLGLAYNFSAVQHWSMFGYPAVKPWNGKFMAETEASYASVDGNKTPNTLGIGTTQLGGCSGGPWIKDFVPGGNNANNLANGVNSYSIDGQDYEIFTPYFDSSVKAIKDEAVAQ